MKIKVKDICKVLEDFAPLNIQESYDNCGLHIGDREMEVEGAILAIDVTEELVIEAIEKRCNMIITHHPLIFKGLKTITGEDYIQKIVILCIKHNIAVYAAHTNFDKILNGVSHRMAEKLKLTEVRKLVPDPNNSNIGLGCIGELPKALPTEIFINKIKTAFGVKVIKHSKLLKDNIKTVALCGGSGAEFIDAAINANADIYISADISYHYYFNTRDRIIITDIGHYESEKYTKEIFYEQLTNIFPNFALYYAACDKSPVLYS